MLKNFYYLYVYIAKYLKYSTYRNQQFNVNKLSRCCKVEKFMLTQLNCNGGFLLCF